MTSRSNNCLFHNQVRRAGYRENGSWWSVTGSRRWTARYVLLVPSSKISMIWTTSAGMGVASFSSLIKTQALPQCLENVENVRPWMEISETKWPEGGVSIWEHWKARHSSVGNTCTDLVAATIWVSFSSSTSAVRIWISVSRLSHNCSLISLRKIDWQCCMASGHPVFNNMYSTEICWSCISTSNCFFKFSYRAILAPFQRDNK